MKASTIGRDDRDEAEAQRPIGGEGSEQGDDRLGSLLEPEHLEALMVETVDRVFEAPVAGAILEQRCEFTVEELEVLQ